MYGTRGQTRSDQFLTVRDPAGFRAFDDAERTRFEEWLVRRAMEHERPKPLHALACEHLRSIRVVRPGVDALVRMIGAARDRAHAATFDVLGDQFTPDRLAGLDRLLALRKPGEVTWLESRRRGAGPDRTACRRLAPRRWRCLRDRLWPDPSMALLSRWSMLG